MRSRARSRGHGARRQFAAAALLVLSASAAWADAWMVKASTVGCRDRETLVALGTQGDGAARAAGLPEGCVGLEAGERLLDKPRIAGGFDDYVQLERHDASLVFVKASDVVPDPGIGSVYEDRVGE